jgi:hypothetical protein
MQHNPGQGFIDSGSWMEGVEIEGRGGVLDYTWVDMKMGHGAFSIPEPVMYATKDSFICSKT